MTSYRFSYCALCGQPATDGHHIIPRGHIGGRAAENWPVNIAPLCHPCHMRWHSEGPRRALGRVGISVDEGGENALRELWARMEYTPVELAVLAALGWHRNAAMYPLVIARSDWVREQPHPDSPVRVRKMQHNAMVDGDWGPLVRLIAGPVPGWMGVE